MLLTAAPAAAVVCISAASAQTVSTVSRPVVQALPSADSQRLNAALARVARDPRDYLALIDAGDAANAMGDPEAAAGFYKRADGISPGHARVKAGLARALVAQGKAAEAIPMFASAEASGAAVDVASDRGLAYDLVGDPVTAQRYYRSVLARGENDDVRRRLGVSLAISGDPAGAEAMLMPLLRKQDKPTWRAHAFNQAIAGKTKEAVDTVNAILPAPLAQSVTPYLRYMPRLTRAQQAAAVNLGKFPRASEIGQDDSAIAAFAPATTRVATADSGLVPRGPQLGSSRSQQVATSSVSRTPALTRNERRARERAELAARAQATQTRVAPPEPKPTIGRVDDSELPALAKSVPMQPVGVAAPANASAPSTSSSAIAPLPAAVASPVVAKASPEIKPPATEAPALAATVVPAPQVGPVQTSSFDLAKVASATEPATVSVPTTAPVATPAAVASATVPAAVPVPAAVTVPSQGNSQWSSDALSLEQAFANLGPPSAVAVPVPGAVDVRAIEPAKPTAEVTMTPPAPEIDPAALRAKQAEEQLARQNAARLEARNAAAKKAAAVKAAAAKKLEDERKAEAAKVAEAQALARRHPSRAWIQVGVGRDKAAIAFDWRKSVRENPEVFSGRNPYINEMGRTNRILIGPFANQRAAAEMLAKVKRAGVASAFIWTSSVGQEVDALVVK